MILIVIIGGITAIVLYEIILEKAMDTLNQVIKNNDTNIPVYSAWVQPYGTLSIGIDDRIANQTLDVYKQRLTNLIGNIPMNLHFGHFELDSQRKN